MNHHHGQVVHDDGQWWKLRWLECLYRQAHPCCWSWGAVQAQASIRVSIFWPLLTTEKLPSWKTKSTLLALTLIIKYAGECRGSHLGLYHQTIDPREESLRQGLVYRQLHRIGGNEQQYYLYRWDRRLHCTLHIALKTFDKVRAAFIWQLQNLIECRQQFYRLEGL